MIYIKLKNINKYVEFITKYFRSGSQEGGSASRSTKHPRDLNNADADEEGGLRGDISKGVANYVIHSLF